MWINRRGDVFHSANGSPDIVDAARGPTIFAGGAALECSAVSERHAAFVRTVEEHAEAGAGAGAGVGNSDPEGRMDDSDGRRSRRDGRRKGNGPHAGSRSGRTHITLRSRSPSFETVATYPRTLG